MEFLKRWWWALAVPLLLWGLAASWQRQGRAQERAAQSARLLDSAKVRTQTLQDSLHTLQSRLAATTARVDTLWRVRTIQLGAANRSRYQADTLIQLALRDTTHVCQLVQEAYQARTSECERLREVVKADSEAITRSRVSLRDAQAGLVSAQEEAHTLLFQLQQVGKPYRCRVVWFVPCPSRTVAVVVGAIGGFVLRGQLR